MDPEENETLLRLGLHRLPARSFPRLRAMAPVLADYDGAAQLHPTGGSEGRPGLTHQLDA